MKTMSDKTVVHRVVVTHQSSLTGEFRRNIYGPYNTPAGASAQANIYAKQGDEEMINWQYGPWPQKPVKHVIGTWVLIQVRIDKVADWETKKMVFEK
jgi:hypothetical protein